MSKSLGGDTTVAGRSRGEAVAVTRGNQCELAGQKSKKEQSNSVKGKRRDDGPSVAACKQRTWRSCSRCRKRQTRRTRNPSSFAPSCPSLLPSACVPGASATALAFPAVVLRGPSSESVPIALSPAGPFCASFPRGASLPLGHTWG